MTVFAAVSAFFAMTMFAAPRLSIVKLPSTLLGRSAAVGCKYGLGVISAVAAAINPSPALILLHVVVVGRHFRAVLLQPPVPRSSPFSFKKEAASSLAPARSTPSSASIFTSVSSSSGHIYN